LSAKMCACEAALQKLRKRFWRSWRILKWTLSPEIYLQNSEFSVELKYDIFANLGESFSMGL
jgi:hypothetical protein